MRTIMLLIMLAIAGCNHTSPHRVHDSGNVRAWHLDHGTRASQHYVPHHQWRYGP